MNISRQISKLLCTYGQSKNVVVTIGKEGAVASSSTHKFFRSFMSSGDLSILHQKTKITEEVVDATGAGDAFCAGFLFSYIHFGFKNSGLTLEMRVLVGIGRLGTLGGIILS